MEKIFLKSTAQEIVIKGNSKEGHTDVFAYDYYGDDNKRKLGGLYIIGNVKQDGDINSENAPDIAYVTNLVASLAKREYYSRSDISPRDAFSATLKKINDVVEEFFSARGGSAYGGKNLKINIGIFAIAGEQILISKLGKFKIILARPAHTGGESRAVDILNNIDLFSKEQVKDKELYNIVSGKIIAGDKLFAFYPNRMVTAREKTIKADLLKFDAKQFTEEINSVKETKPDFDCGALHLSIDSHKELAVKKLTILSSAEKQNRGSSISQPRQNVVGEIGTKLLAKDDIKEVKPEIHESISEVPRIISSEFSLARKVNPLLSSMFAPIKIARDLYRQSFNLKRKFIVLSFVVGVLMIGAVSVKMFLVIDPEQRRLNVVINQAQNNLKLVRTKISQNDLTGARQLLAESLSSINTVGLTNNKAQKTADEIYTTLDNIDKSVEVSPSLLESMPEELNQRIAIFDAHKDRGIALDVYENNLYILTNDNISKIADINSNTQKEPSIWLKSDLSPQSIMLTVDGNVYVMNNSGTLSVYYKGEKVSETNTFIVSQNGDVLLTSKDSDKLYLVNKMLARIYELDKKSGSLIRTLKVGSSEPFVDAYLVGNSTIIIVTPDGRIWELK